MLPLRTTRGALGLYGALLVLPTLVFGWLYWRELAEDHEEQLEAVPATAQDGARRIVAGMRSQLAKLIAAEERRPFYHYGTLFSPEDAMDDELALQPSPLVKYRAPRGILAWFSFDRLAGAGEEIDIFPGSGFRPREENALRARLRPVLEEFRRRGTGEDRLRRLERMDGLAPEPLPLRAIAIHMGHERDLECLKKCSPLIRGMELSIGVSNFHLEFYVDEDGSPRAFATRRVIPMEPLTGLPPNAECLKPLLKGFGLQQGFLVDVDWLFHELPASIAEQALGEAEELVPAPRALPFDNVDSVFAEIHPVRDLGFEADREQDELFGKLEVVIHTNDIDRRFRGHVHYFLGVGLMLVLTLVTGMTLLYRSVNRELEQAHRTQNFVAAVTHELRTPLSTIRLHGEMLLDGWAEDREKRQEYYRRIVRETKRLSTLVERILEKSQLKEGRTEPVPGDLNEVVRSLRRDLDEKEDLTFDLAPGLPPALLTPDAVAGILSNLVENARKYARVPPGGEPIVVRTRAESDRVLLEVADRGPGVPGSEKEKIFEAFYRIGREETRTATGTGLGLHLVSLHAESVGAQASVHERPGGGSTFRIAFLVAPGEGKA